MAEEGLSAEPAGKNCRKQRAALGSSHLLQSSVPK